MARGFYTTLGSTSSDVIVSALTTRPSTRSYSFFSYRNGPGDQASNQFFDRGGDSSNEIFSHRDGSTDFAYTRGFSTTSGQWTITRPSAAAWHHVGLSYDDSSTSNIPSIYLDGASQSVTQTSTPSGTAVSTSGAYYIGNRDPVSAGERCWDGMLAEFAIWDAILNSVEFQALGQGVSPLLIRPTALVEYIPMNDGTVRSYFKGAPTVTGTVLQTHPRVLYPWREPMVILPAASAGGSIKRLLTLGVG